MSFDGEGQMSLNILKTISFDKRSIGRAYKKRKLGVKTEGT